MIAAAAKMAPSAVKITLISVVMCFVIKYVGSC